MPAVVNYADARGREPVDDYIVRLFRAGEKSAAATIARYVELLEEHGVGLPMPFARIIDREQRLYELRPGDHRIAYAEHGAAIVLLHAWRKQTRTLDRRQANRARNRLDHWRERHQRPR